MADQNQQNPAKGTDDGRDHRMDIGLPMGVALGVVLSLIFDNWAFMGAGIAMGLVYGGMPVVGRRTNRAADRSEGAEE